MPWLKKQQPFKLYQSSDIPYVILEDGVRLFCYNCFGQEPDQSEHNLSFVVQSNTLRRINTYFYKLESFPVTIPFSDIIALDEAIIEGRTIKHVAGMSEDSQKISIIKSEYIRNISDIELSDLNDQLEDFDHNFILVGDTIDPQTRLFDGLATIMHHSNWNRTMIAIAHNICPSPHRKYCWTRLIPELQVSYYGYDGEDIASINDALDNGGIDANVNWDV